jgi:uncharacterized membrane protein YuzA (DUF378 family)
MAFAKTALTLIIIGAVNWLLVGLFQWDLVSFLFGGDAIRDSSVLSRFIYTIVGLAGLFSIPLLFRSRYSANPATT